MNPTNSRKVACMWTSIPASLPIFHAQRMIHPSHFAKRVCASVANALYYLDPS